MRKALHQPMSKRQTLLAVCVVVGLCLLGWFGWEFYARLTGRPKSVPQIKRDIWKHVAHQGRTKSFEPPFNIADAAFVGSRTSSNRTARITKSKSPGLPETTVSEYFRTNQNAASSYEVMYRLIGQELFVTDALIGKPDTDDKLAAMVLASEASAYARTNTRDPWLSARICEAYLWPHLSLVEVTNQAGLTADAVLTTCELAYSEAWETNRLVPTYERLISQAKRTQTADAARFRLALICMDQGNDRKALELLKAITTIKTAKITREIARLETVVNKGGNAKAGP